MRSKTKVMHELFHFNNPFMACTCGFLLMVHAANNNGVEARQSSRRLCQGPCNEFARLNATSADSRTNTEDLGGSIRRAKGHGGHEGSSQ